MGIALLVNILEWIRVMNRAILAEMANREQLIGGNGKVLRSTRMTNKIKIKLKECCLTCEHFDPKGIKGFGYCPPADGKREISCGHMEVCKTYLEAAENGNQD